MAERMILDVSDGGDSVPDSGTEILDEIRKNSTENESQEKTENETRKKKDPKLCLGSLTCQCVRECVAQQYPKYAGSLPTTLGSTDDCADQFILEKLPYIVEKAKREDKFENNGAFRHYIASAVKTWFSALVGKDTELIRDVVRARLRRMTKAGKGPIQVPGKGRAVRWGLVNGPREPSCVDMAALKAVASRFPLEVDYTKNLDSSRKRSVQLGKKGQLDALLIGILEQAQGTLSAAQMTSIVLYRLPLLTGPEFVSVDAPIGNDGDVPALQLADHSTPDPAEFIDEESRTRTRISEVILDFLESAEQEEKQAAHKIVDELGIRNDPADIAKHARSLLDCLLGTEKTAPLMSVLTPPSLMEYLIPSTDSNK